LQIRLGSFRHDECLSGDSRTELNVFRHLRSVARVHVSPTNQFRRCQAVSRWHRTSRRVAASRSARAVLQSLTSVLGPSRHSSPFAHGCFRSKQTQATRAAPTSSRDAHSSEPSGSEGNHPHSVRQSHDFPLPAQPLQVNRIGCRERLRRPSSIPATLPSRRLPFHIGAHNRAIKESASRQLPVSVYTGGEPPLVEGFFPLNSAPSCNGTLAN
jgi:hypothetical protein